MAQRGDREREERGTGGKKGMQVSLSHNHAHHDSMCTDRRTRVGGEGDSQEVQKKGTLVQRVAEDDKMTRKRQTMLRSSLPCSCEYNMLGRLRRFSRRSITLDSAGCTRGLDVRS